MEIAESVKPLVDELRHEANRYVAEDTVAPIDPQGYAKYLVSSDRRVFESQYFERRRQLVVLSLAYYLDHKAPELALLERVVTAICDERRWALPAHIPVVEGKYVDNAETWIDLFAAETGEGLSEMQQLIGSAFSADFNMRIKQEINRRIFTSFESRDWPWMTAASNWSAVIGGSIGMSAIMQLADDPKRRDNIISKLDSALKVYLSSFGDDGASTEGVGYWSYGFGYYIYFAEMAARKLGQTKYLDDPKVKEIAQFPYRTMLNATTFVPFSDSFLVPGKESNGVASGLLDFCKNALNVPIPPIFVNPIDDDDCYRFAHLTRSLFWTKTPRGNVQKYPDARHYFKNAQWLIERYSTHNFVFAAKGGSNDESHNHLDVGQFVIGNNKTLYITDLGPGKYTKDYFDPKKRYEDFAPAAASHTIPVINGQEERAGHLLTKADYDEQANTFILNLTDGYKNTPALKSFKRMFAIAADQRTLQLTDQFTFNQPDNLVVENFVSRIKPQVDKQQVILTDAHGRCVMNFESSQVTVTKRQYETHLAGPADAYQIQVTHKVAAQGQINLTVQIEG